VDGAKTWKADMHEMRALIGRRVITLRVINNQFLVHDAPAQDGAGCARLETVAATSGSSTLYWEARMYMVLAVGTPAQTTAAIV
jgi:hypothetical protein